MLIMNNNDLQTLTKTHTHRGSPLPHITVCAVLKRSGKFLMVEELSSQNERVFNQPSGHVDKRENAIDAVKRETFEETRWRFSPTAIVGIYFYHSERSDVTYQRICFTGDLIAEDSSAKLDPVIIQPHWLTRDEIIKRQDQLRSPLVLKCIDDFLDGVRYPLELISNHLK